jgi:uncharacterized protein involved in exopolysaccharide biosynthesis
MEEPQKERALGLELIRLSLRHIRLLAKVVGAALLASVLFTAPIFIKPEYKSEVVLYPAGASTSASLLNSDIRFGFDRDVDNAMQVLQSTILRDSLIRKYDLMHHYEIDTTDPKKQFLLIETIKDNISVERTRYNSILIKVYDTDPRLAAAIANDMVRLGDKVKAEIIRRNLRSAYQTVEREMRLKMEQLTQLADSIRSLKRKNYHDAIGLLSNRFTTKQHHVDQLRTSLDRVRTEENIYDLGKQYNAIYKVYVTAVANFLTDSGMVAVMSKKLSEEDTTLIRRRAAMEGARILVEDLKGKLARLNRSGARYNQLMDNYSTEKSLLSGLLEDFEVSTSTFEKEYDNLPLATLKNKYTAELDMYKALKAKYELALNNLTDLVPASYVISPAEVPTKKVFPQRLLITALVCVGVYLLAILVLFTLENKDAIRRELA